MFCAALQCCILAGLSKEQMGVLLAATFAVLVALSRTVVLIVLTYGLPLNVSSCETNSTHLNSSNCTEIPESRSRYFQVTDMLYVFYSFMTLPWF